MRRKQRKIQPLASKLRRTKKNACYVLITCGEPNKDGKMDVEMTYEGDTLLAAYLLENAQSILDDELTPRSIIPSASK